MATDIKKPSMPKPANKKARNCTKGVACGFGCINKKKKCRVTQSKKAKQVTGSMAETIKQVKEAGEQKPAKKCNPEKSYLCGKQCISNSKKCKKDPDAKPNAKTQEKAIELKKAVAEVVPDENELDDDLQAAIDSLLSPKLKAAFALKSQLDSAKDENDLNKVKDEAEKQLKNKLDIESKTVLDDVYVKTNKKLSELQDVSEGKIGQSISKIENKNERKLLTALSKKLALADSGDELEEVMFEIDFAGVGASEQSKQAIKELKAKAENNAYNFNKGSSIPPKAPDLRKNLVYTDEQKSSSGVPDKDWGSKTNQIKEAGIKQKAHDTLLKAYEAKSADDSMSSDELRKAKSYNDLWEKEEYSDNNLNNKIKHIENEGVGISRIEAHSLATYISQGYKNQNANFYKTSSEDGSAESAVAASVAVHKLPTPTIEQMKQVVPDYEQGQKLIRGISGLPNPEAFAKSFRNADGGKKYISNTFMSTTMLDRDDNTFSVEAGVEVRVTRKEDGTSEGKLVDKYKNMANEGEVLFPPLSEYNVNDVYEEGGIWIVDLTEI